jgi:hypothetical protein
MLERGELAGVQKAPVPGVFFLPKANAVNMMQRSSWEERGRIGWPYSGPLGFPG